ncbi:MAG: hypothetical protein EZS28_033369, partial [Streblomastix strix]
MISIKPVSAGNDNSRSKSTERSKLVETARNGSGKHTIRCFNCLKVMDLGGKPPVSVSSSLISSSSPFLTNNAIMSVINPPDTKVAHFALVSSTMEPPSAYGHFPSFTTKQDKQEEPIGQVTFKMLIRAYRLYILKDVIIQKRENERKLREKIEGGQVSINLNIDIYKPEINHVPNIKSNGKLYSSTIEYAAAIFNGTERPPMSLTYLSLSNSSSITPPYSSLQSFYDSQRNKRINGTNKELNIKKHVFRVGQNDDENQFAKVMAEQKKASYGGGTRVDNQTQTTQNAKSEIETGALFWNEDNNKQQANRKFSTDGILNIDSPFYSQFSTQQDAKTLIRPLSTNNIFRYRSGTSSSSQNDQQLYSYRNYNIMNERDQMYVEEIEGGLVGDDFMDTVNIDDQDNNNNEMDQLNKKSNIDEEKWVDDAWKEQETQYMKNEISKSKLQNQEQQQQQQLYQQNIGDERLSDRSDEEVDLNDELEALQTHFDRMFQKELDAADTDLYQSGSARKDINNIESKHKKSKLNIESSQISDNQQNQKISNTPKKKKKHKKRKDKGQSAIQRNITLRFEAACAILD